MCIRKQRLNRITSEKYFQKMNVYVQKSIIMFDAYNEYLSISRQQGEKIFMKGYLPQNYTTLQILRVYKYLQIHDK